MQKQAKEQNVRLAPTAITGTEVPDIYADFKLNAAGNRVVECPAGQPGNENRRIQTALPDTEWSGNSSFDIETYLPCRPDAGERLHSKPFFLRV